MQIEHLVNGKTVASRDYFTTVDLIAAHVPEIARTENVGRAHRVAVSPASVAETMETRDDKGIDISL